MAANTPFSVAFWAHVYIGPPGPLRPGSDDQKAVVIIIKELQLTLEQHEFELCRCIDTGILFTSKYHIQDYDLRLVDAVNGGSMDTDG